jgi:hypothetical protein
MKGNYPLNKQKLNRVLLELLKHKEVRLTFQHMTAQQGHNEWDDILPPTNIVIKVDANQQTGNIDHVGTVVHELIHVVIMPMCNGWFDEELEETLVLALDAQITAYIRKSPKRLHDWTEAIDAKLKECDP